MNPRSLGFTMIAGIVVGAALFAWLRVGSDPRRDSAIASSDASKDADAAASATATHARQPSADYLAFSDLAETGMPAQATSMPAAGTKEQMLALYRKRHRCAHAAGLQHAMDNPRTQEQLASLQLEDLPAEERAERLAMIDAAFKYVDESVPGCEGMVGQILDGSMYTLSLRAADAGDADAAMCYASGSYAVPAELLRNPAWRAEFARNANRLFERGMEQGDWRFVVLAQIAIPARRTDWKLQLPETPLDATHLQLFNLMAPHGDPVRAYRYARLYALGAGTASEANGRSARADAIGGSLDAATRGQADAWAHATYARAYASRPTIPNTMRTCR